MNIDQLRDQLPNEDHCREFFEKMIWPYGRYCPHCACEKSYAISGSSVRPGLYECSRCKRQFTVTTKTPMHSTKLPLWKWLLLLYYILNSSKGVSSKVIARLVGISQPTAWKVGHAIRKMMDNWSMQLPPLKGIIEMDEKFFGGNPRFHYGQRREPKNATEKQRILIVTERKGQAFLAPVEKVKNKTITPIIDFIADKSSTLMTDKSYVFSKIGEQFASHQSVYHTAKEYATGDTHINTAEAIGSLLERTKTGVFHYISEKHLCRYLSELSFRWLNRDSKQVVTKSGKRKTIWQPKPISVQLSSLLPYAFGSQLRRSVSGGIKDIDL